MLSLAMTMRERAIFNYRQKTKIARQYFWPSIWSPFRAKFQPLNGDKIIWFDALSARPAVQRGMKVPA